MSEQEMLSLSDAVNQSRDRLLKSKLGTPRGRITRFMTSQKARQWIVAIGITLFLIGGMASVVCYEWAFRRAVHNMFAGKTGPVLLRDEWPKPLMHLLEDSAGVKIDESSIKVHSLCDGVWDKEFVWRMDLTPGLFELIEKQWKLDSANGADWGVLQDYTSAMTHERTPAWWTPRNDGQTVFYVSPDGYDGTGDHFRVGVEEDRSTIWIHLYYKF